MESREIREKFLEFFKSKDHKVVSSAPMVVKNDPTLMFINAGMNQFKDIFLENSKASNLKVTNTQKCLRVSGKHNDLEEVGVDTYHHTMFEMLGNWSFGDYFKKDAIYMAWELLTKVYKIDKTKFYITIFDGDKNDKLNEDSEAFNIWKEIVPENRILKCSKKDNFWEMGQSGPCGPCSEIHIDLRSEKEKKDINGIDLVNKDHPQVVEIWNLVFIEYNRLSDGSLEKLKKKHVDTGMGFERLAMVMQNKVSNYDTDVFRPLIEKIEKFSDLRFIPNDNNNEQINVAMRVIADHIRAISFSIADGQLPSNTGAGYVIRRILRRAVRYGYQVLKLDEPFLYKLLDVLSMQFTGVFPELIKQKDFIEKVIFEEEKSFYRTIEQGIARLDILCIEAKEKNLKEINAKDVFELYDRFGFPLDLTKLITNENNLSINEEDFNIELSKQKNRSKKAAEITTSDWIVLKEDETEEFIGYDYTKADIYITRYREIVEKDKTKYQLVFNLSPFYAEGGGQIGDTGIIINKEDEIKILDTKKENKLIVHFSNKLPKNIKSKFIAKVDLSKRILTASNHTATHLLHFALRNVLGTHVQQKGSLVNDKHLRFDFSHFAKLSDDEINNVENKVNELIRSNILLDERRDMPILEANKLGAMMLFGEKYDDVVRLIKFGDSIELCGGIHVNSTSEIGFFKIISESSISTGVRRIEAITSDVADKFVKTQIDTILKLKSLLKSPNDVLSSVRSLLNKNAQLEKEIHSLNKLKTLKVKEDLLASIKHIDNINFIASKVDLDADSMKSVSFELKDKVDDLFLVLGSEANNKAVLTIMISESLVKERNFNAGNIIRNLAKEISGGGGGQAFFATAGGKNPQGLDKALDKASLLIKQ